MALYERTLYPLFGLRSLRSQRGERWAKLVDHISKLPMSDPQVMALTVTTRRLRRNTGLEHSTCRDPFCAVCAAQVVANFDGSEQELLNLYHRNLDDVKMAMSSMRMREGMRFQTSAVA
jgi:hypothetical protein